MSLSPPVLRGETRRQKILEILSEELSVSVSGLAARLSTSTSSIRRDLAQLEREGRLRRTHGGAVLDGGQSLSFAEKLGRNPEAKRRIAREAITRIAPGTTVGLDGGTTTQLIAEHLPALAGLTVVTNSLEILLALAGRRDLQVISVGGTLQPHTLALVGGLTREVLARVPIDLVFVGADGLVADGFSTTTEGEAVVKRHLLEAAERKVLVADAEKLGRRAPFRVGGFEEIDELITDEGAGPEVRPWLAGLPLELTIV